MSTFQPDISRIDNQKDMAGPPSIISSRMTDIASDDGADNDLQQSTTGRRSQLASDVVSRPGTARTARTGMSSRTQSQPLRQVLSGKRGSVTANSVAGSTASGRPGSSISRSHVPSLTSHAFFHPISSQKLQAQRGVTRPSAASRRQSGMDGEPVAEDEQSPGRQSLRSSVPAGPSGPVSSPAGLGDPGPDLLARLARQTVEDAEMQLPPSRGTERTGHETLDRITANTSPTYGHYPTGSLSESVRPLQRKTTESRNKGLSVRVDKKIGPGLPTPIRTPRSFRSSFLLPTKGDATAQNGANRSMEGGEKLESVASTPQLSPSVPAGAAKSTESRADTVAAKMGRNFEYFEGNTVFCLGGRFQNTRSQPVNIATGTFVVAPAALFFVFSAPWIWYNIHPAIPVTFGYLFYICISSFLHASSSDPGILPRNLHQFPPPDENEDPLRLGPPMTDWTLIKSSEAPTAAMEVPTKYCKTCNIWRPPRAYHCRVCDNCIETADHHCVWLNNCVGRRNYRYFFTFVSSATLLACFLLGASLAQILVYLRNESTSFGQAIDHFKVPFALAIYGFISSLYPAALMLYHIFLMARGETTREFLNSHKLLKKDRYRAFTQGSWVKNWIVVLCRPRPPTYYRFKVKHMEGDQRLAARRKSELRRAAESKEGVEMEDVNPPPSTGFQGPIERNPALVS